MVLIRAKGQRGVLPRSRRGRYRIEPRGEAHTPGDLTPTPADLLEAEGLYERSTLVDPAARRALVDQALALGLLIRDLSGRQVSTIEAAQLISATKVHQRTLERLGLIPRETAEAPPPSLDVDDA